MRVFRLLLYRQQQLGSCLLELPASEMRTPADLQYGADEDSWAEPRCGLAMLDSEGQVACQQSQEAAGQSAARITRIQVQCAIDQGNHCADVLGEISQGWGAVGQGNRIVASHTQGSPSIIEGLAPIDVRVCA